MTAAATWKLSLPSSVYSCPQHGQVTASCRVESGTDKAYKVYFLVRLYWGLNVYKKMIPRTAGSKEKSVVVYNTFGPLSTVRLVYPVNFGLEALALQGELYGPNVL